MNKKQNIKTYEFIVDAVMDETILYYKGGFSQTVLAQISQRLKHQYHQTPRILSRVNAVLVELAQNIAYHSAEYNFLNTSHYDKGVGSVLIQERREDIVITAANLISVRDVEIIRDRCKQINELAYDQLRALKKELRMTPLGDPQKKGGNIGLVQVALKAKSKLKVDITAVNDTKYFLVITSNIKK